MNLLSVAGGEDLFLFGQRGQQGVEDWILLLVEYSSFGRACLLKGMV